MGSSPWLAASVAACCAALAAAAAAALAAGENRRLRRLLEEGEEAAAAAAAAAAAQEEEEKEGAPSSSPPSSSEEEFSVRPIGILSSPFPQRAGTPRQGLLAPSVRSTLHLRPDLPPEAVEGLAEYSHVWVLFRFHLNPVGKARGGGGGGGGRDRPWPAKIRPPRANGRKVGVLATRSPHRPNDLGLSLALLERVEVVEQGGRRGRGSSRRRVAVRMLGLDLVDGTPVLDLKPYVPWDAVADPGPMVPAWVARDDAARRVTWADGTIEAVVRARIDGALAPMYPPLKARGGGGGGDRGDNEGDGDGDGGHDDDGETVMVMRALEEIVAQDPRSIREGRGTASSPQGGGGSGEEGGPATAPFVITFGGLRVGFRVLSPEAGDGDGSGGGGGGAAEIVSVVRDPGDSAAAPGSYPHGLHLRRVAELEAEARDLPKPRWAHPVREGRAGTLMELEGGGSWGVCPIK